MGKYLKRFSSVAEYEAATFDKPNVSYIDETEAVMYNPYVPPSPSYDSQYLTFEAIESGTFKFNGNAVSYSLDNGTTWTSLASNTDSPTVNSGETIMFKATLPSEGTFSSTGRFNAMGNIMSLLYGDNFSGQTSLSGKDYAFYNMFSGCTGLTDASNLILPATTLASNCYREMFRGCTSLTTAPTLPATTLENNCYYAMFNGCTSLSGITCLATDISAFSCTFNWVQGVSATGTFTKASSMTSWSSGISGIPTGWTVQDYAE